MVQEPVLQEPLEPKPPESILTWNNDDISQFDQKLDFSKQKECPQEFDMVVKFKKCQKPFITTFYGILWVKLTKQGENNA